MGLIKKLINRIRGKENDDQYAYNYNYVPPLAMIDKVPGLGFSLHWAVLVGIQGLRIVINVIAVTIEKDLSHLRGELEEFVDSLEEGKLLEAARDLCDLIGKVKDEDDDSGDVLGCLERLVARQKEEEFNAFQDQLEVYLRKKLPVDNQRELQDYNDLFETLPIPAVSKTFDLDQTFANMRVAGPNPLVIERMTQPLLNFPIKPEQFEAVMGESMDVAIQEGRVYVADYKVFNGVLQGSFPMPQKYLCAPIAMYAVPKGETHLKPVAVQCAQTPGQDNPIVTPPSSGKDYRWEMAKTAVQIADGNYHEAISHLGRTHLFVEPFVVATMNCLDDDHPVSKLLTPHFEGTLFINNAAQASLISPEGIVDELLGGTIDASRVAAVLGTQGYTFDFNNSFLDDELKRRGVADKTLLPYYPYRDNALMIWDAILQWVDAYMTIYYPNQQDPANDAPLQTWLAQLTSHEGGRLKNIGENGEIATRDYLTKMAAHIIFTASAQHAAVNFPQLNIMSYVPAMPLAGYVPQPPGDTEVTEQDWLALMPPVKTALTQVNVGTLLGGVYYTCLGQYKKDAFPDEVDDALKTFQENLEKIEEVIKQNDPEETYPFLLPSRIPQSINI